MVGSGAVVIWGFLGFLDGGGLRASSLVGFRFGMGGGCGDGDDARFLGEVEFEMTRV
jgi:hypothetical protein